MGSSRLPGKSMMDLGGEPLIARVLERMKRNTLLDETVLATTEKSEDDVLAEWADNSGVAVFRGSDMDLVGRYYWTAKAYDADVIVRVPGDNPVSDPTEGERIIRHHLLSDNDMSSNYSNVADSPVVEQNGYPEGIGAEVYDFDAFERVHLTATDPRNREHPHTNFFENPDLYRVGTLDCPADIRRPELYFYVNTPSEYEFIASLYGYLYPRNPKFTIRDVLRWYDDVYTGKGP